MNVKLRVLSIGVLFFAGHTVMAQKAKRDTTTKTKEIEEVNIAKLTERLRRAID